VIAPIATNTEVVISEGLDVGWFSVVDKQGSITVTVKVVVAN
jgi:hypothetical protein